MAIYLYIWLKLTINDHIQTPIYVFLFSPKHNPTKKTLNIEGGISRRRDGLEGVATREDGLMYCGLGSNRRKCVNEMGLELVLCASDCD